MPDDQPLDVPGCLDRVRHGDQVAARELVEHLYPLVIRIVRSHLPRRTQEEDLAQDVFLKMFTRLEQYEGAVPFAHWVSRIAVTTCIDQLRAEKRRPEFRWADLSENEAEVLDSVLSDDGGLMAQLNPADRLVIRLMDIEQKSVAKIGALTGWNQSLVKVRAFRARRKLRKLFEELEKKESS